MKIMQNALVILAGGKGTRFGQKTPKQFFQINNISILDILISRLDLSDFTHIVLCIIK